MGTPGTASCHVLSWAGKGNAPLWVPFSVGWTTAHQERSEYKITPVSGEGDRPRTSPGFL